MLVLRYPVNFIGITQIFINNKHYGIDLGWNSNYGGKYQGIYASLDGIVCKVVDNNKSNKSWGNYVKIDHGNSIYTLYAHLKEGILVKNKQIVKQGDLIGYMGNTGNSRGNHLHFELYSGGASTKYRVNPLGNLFVYPTQLVANSTLKDFDLKYYNSSINTKKYIVINAKNGVWCRKGIGYKYTKYKAIPYNTKCELLEKNISKSNGYYWDKIIYLNNIVYIPNKWNKYVEY